MYPIQVVHWASYGNDIVINEVCIRDQWPLRPDEAVMKCRLSDEALESDAIVLEVFTSVRP